MSILFNKANPTDKSLDLANFNRMVDYVGRLANMISPNMLIDRNPNGYVLKVLPSTSTSSTMSYSDWAFGFSISGTQVTVNVGAVFQGKRPPRYTASPSTVNITADYQYTSIQYPWESGVVFWGTPTTVEPVSDASYFRCWLHQFRLVAGVVSLYRIGHLGNIYIPGAWA